MTQAVPVRAAELALRPPRWIFFAIFAISGFSGLIYESIWTHYLKLFLGHAAYAQSLVLMIFMGGLALGSWLTAKFPAVVRRPLVVYALVEAIIGVAALLFHGVFVSVSDGFYFSLLPSLSSPAFAGVLKWAAGTLLMLPQTVLLGMTFPLMSTGIVRRFPDQPGASVAMLYFTNSIGAAVGVLVSGFWLVGVVGLPGTMLTAGLLNIALALVVWALVRSEPQVATPAKNPQRTAETDALATLFFVAAGVTGATSFMYEIGWIRMLSLVLGSTTHSFELMLSAFITGLALGGLWIKRRIDRVGDGTRFAGWVQVAMGVMAVLTVPLYVATFDMMAGFLSAVQHNDAGYTLFIAFSHTLALVVMVPTTFFAGMTLPLFTHVLMRSAQGERAIGQVYAANTLGSIAGVLFAVHIGLPLFGLKSLITFGAALDILLGLVLLHRSGAHGRIGAVARAAFAGAAVLLVVAVGANLEPRRLTSGVFRYGRAELDPEAKVLFYADGKTASVGLTLAPGGEVIIWTNGKPDAGIQMKPGLPATGDEITMVMVAALPLAYKPDAKTVANIGLGSGMTTHTLLADPAIEQVDTVEIESAVITAARGFGDRVRRTFTDPRSHIHLEDAKTFFSLQNRAYDVIVAEPSNPWVSGVAGLFSEEFYRTIPLYLKPDGVLVQWLQLYEFNDELAISVLKALSAHFSDFAIYNTDGENILIVARPTGRLGQPDFGRVLSGALAKDLANVRLNSPADFAIRNTGSKRQFDAVAARSGSPPNSDFFPFLDLHAGKARFMRQTPTMFSGWRNSPLPLLEMTGIEPFSYAEATVSAIYDRTVRVQDARLAVETLATDGATAATFADPDLALARSLAASCEARDSEELRLQTLHAVAVRSLAFLDIRDGAAVLDAALPAACVEHGSERLRTWIDLYRAVANRDAGGMAARGVRAVADERSDDDRRLYALTAAMLGSLNGGRPDRALALWQARPAALENAHRSPDIELILDLAWAAVDGAPEIRESRADAR
ncbi:MAG TPA: spermidine synthase [Gammaproteobacteria bacterium]|nr:spermidine synthase [Gammaproteobacteria bacterium]